MSLFKKRKGRATAIPNGLFVQLGQAIDHKQRKAAAYLGRKTQYWNSGSKIIALALFCLLFGGVSLLLLIKAIIHF